MSTRPSRVVNRNRARKAKQQTDNRVSPPPQPLRIWSLLSMAVLGGGLVIASVVGYGMWRTGEQFMDGVKLMFTPEPPED